MTSRRPPVLLGLLVVVAMVLGAPATTPPAAAAPAPAAGSTPPSRVLVRLADRVETRAMAAAPGVASVHGGAATGISVLQLEPGQSAAATAARLAARPDVVWAEPDRLVHASDLGHLVDDPLSGYLWGLENTGQVIGGLTGLAGVDVDVAGAWTHTRGARDVVVGVVDTGIDVRHPDLAANIWHNPGEVAGNGVDDDHNGYVDDVTGWDFHHDDATVFDDPVADRHGTHVAGTIAAVGNDGHGIVGVAPGVRILPLKFMGDDGSGWTSDAVAALEYAAAMGVDVVNLSWGGPDSSRALSEAIASLDAVVVAAAGNDGLDLDTSAIYPAAFPHRTILSVAAVDGRGRLASFSNTGASTVDVGAPGVGVLSTIPGGQYAWMGGTSMAAPHVTGVVALARSVAPDLPPADLVDAVVAAARPLASLAGHTRSGGMVDAGAVVAGLLAATTAPDPAPPRSRNRNPRPHRSRNRNPTPAPEPTPTPTLDPAPPPTTTTVTRLAGTDRYATGAAITADAFPRTVHDVYVATGASFADALSGAAAAAVRGAPVLLVAPTGVPDPVREELARLRPDRVWVLGGPAVVPDAVVAELSRTTSARVTRLAGADRYRTSARISAHAFAPGVPVAYLAIGTAFPDALAAGAAAGRAGGPVLLTAGGTLPSAIRDELARLRPGRVVVLGGTGAVSEAVRLDAGRAAGAPTRRIGGQTRYETAAAVVADAFPDATDVVMLATGESFPDALGGGAAAATRGAAVLLVPPSGPLPAATAAQLRRLSPTTLLVLGGTGALPTTTLDRVTASLR